MTNLLLPLVMVLAGASGPSAPGRHPDAVEVYHCDFGEAADANFDRWPDGWTRRRGWDYPQYLDIAISDEPSPAGDRALRVELDGGAAAVYSPPIDVRPMFGYMLEAYVKTEDLKHDVAYYSITFYDADRKPLETYHGRHLHDVPDWKKVRIGPITPQHKDIRLAVIGLHLEPTGRADLKGAALFDDVWLARMPRMSLTSNSRHNVYTGPDQVEVTCEVSGILERDPMMTFELIDVGSRQLATMQERLNGEVVALKKSVVSKLLREGASPTLGKTLTESDRSNFTVTGKMTWKPPIKNYGFYRVRVRMAGREGLMQERMIPLVVIRPEKSPTGGEFGWSLPRGDDPLPLGPLASLLGKMGINWVKFPVWYGEKETKRADELAWFAERLSSENIEMVALLDQPPAEVRDLFGEADELLAAGVFAEPKLWHPVLDPVMTRLALKVRWWQLGRDEDISFVGYPDLNGKIGEVKKQLERFGQNVHLGIGWRWLNEPPKSADPPWDFLSYTADPPLTQKELATYLEADSSDAAQRWVVLDPLSRKHYDVEERARDLVGRMLAAKMAGADCVFIPQPFNTEHGLMNDDGTPGELLLPWRTAALLISGTEYVGSMRLPGGSRNYVLSRGEDAVMVVWNERPVKETIYLGEDENIEQVDLWGRVVKPEKNGYRQAIEVGPLPTFITGVNLAVARLRMSFAFDRKQLSSVFGRPQTASYRLKNFFGRGMSGKITLVTPDVWETTPRSNGIKLAAGEELSEPFQVLLRAGANSGEQEVRADFDITADRSYKFSAYRTINVGLGDVVMEFGSRINQRGELIVEQHMMNKTDQFVSFKCLLYAPNRRRLRQLVLNLARGRDTKIYKLPQGEQLVGKTIYLRAEEIGGDRILNYSFTVER